MNGRRVVGVGGVEVGEGEDVLVAIGLGSCVAVLVHDPAAGIGGLAHVLLPEPSVERHRATPGRFASTAVPMLIEALIARGASRERLVARLVGGASMFGALLAAGTVGTGARNVAAVRDALKREGVPVVGEEVGLEHGRTVHFHAGDGRTHITSASRADVFL